MPGDMSGEMPGGVSGEMPGEKEDAGLAPHTSPAGSGAGKNTRHPATTAASRDTDKTTLVIACGALAQELVFLKKVNSWSHWDIQCLPAEWHNTPDRITPAIERKITEQRKHYQKILIAYGDCGTGGLLDALLEREQIERLPGPHCYSFFAGENTFNDISNDEIGTFYLTDYLAANFNRLILKELGIEKHPELKEMYFGHYRKLVYLSQRDDNKLTAKAESAARALSLDFEIRHTGLDPLEKSIRRIDILPIETGT